MGRLTLRSRGFKTFVLQTCNTTSTKPPQSARSTGLGLVLANDDGFGELGRRSVVFQVFHPPRSWLICSALVFWASRRGKSCYGLVGEEKEIGTGVKLGSGSVGFVWLMVFLWQSQAISGSCKEVVKLDTPNTTKRWLSFEKGARLTNQLSPWWVASCPLEASKFFILDVCV